MELVHYFQSFASPVLTFFASLFDFCGSIAFFALAFSILFFFFDKEVAYKFFVGFNISFLFSSLFVKNIVKRQRPYVQDEGILSDRNSFTNYSFPSFSTSLSMQTTCAFLGFKNKNTNRISPNIFAVFGFVLFNIFIIFSKIYFAESFLLDLIVGLIIGFLIYYLVFKFIKFTKKLTTVLVSTNFVVLTILFFAFFGDVINNNFENIILFNFIGLSLSMTLGIVLQNKIFIYKIKNNLIFSTLKILILTIFFVGFYFLSKISFGLLIFSFVKYFVLGFCITFVLPFVFSKLEKYFYIFSVGINEDCVLQSKISLSENQTQKIAKKISRFISAGDCVLLEGDLGAGKSVFVRSVLKHCGIAENITSPTFTLVNEYKNKYYHFYHFDLYRLDDEDEVLNIGFEEMMDDKGAIKFIEWPSKVKKYLPNTYKKITITKLGKNLRNIIFEKIDSRES